MDPAEEMFEKAKAQAEAFEKAQAEMAEAIAAAKAEKSGDYITAGLYALKHKMGFLSDREQARVIMALGLAAAQTYLLFYTDSAETLAGEAGEIATATSDAISGIAAGLGKAFPDVSFTGA